jgi:hypothetical protein
MGKSKSFFITRKIAKIPSYTGINNITDEYPMPHLEQQISPYGDGALHRTAKHAAAIRGRATGDMTSRHVSHDVVATNINVLLQTWGEFWCKARCNAASRRAVSVFEGAPLADDLRVRSSVGCFILSEPI